MQETLISVLICNIGSEYGDEWVWQKQGIQILWQYLLHRACCCQWRLWRFSQWLGRRPVLIMDKTFWSRRTFYLLLLGIRIRWISNVFMSTVYVFDWRLIVLVWFSSYVSYKSILFVHSLSLSRRYCCLSNVDRPRSFHSQYGTDINGIPSIAATCLCFSMVPPVGFLLTKWCGPSTSKPMLLPLQEYVLRRTVPSINDDDMMNWRRRLWLMAGTNKIQNKDDETTSLDESWRCNDSLLRRVRRCGGYLFKGVQVVYGRQVLRCRVPEEALADAQGRLQTPF